VEAISDQKKAEEELITAYNELKGKLGGTVS
jgi:hypothetical protein